MSKGLGRKTLSQSEFRAALASLKCGNQAAVIRGIDQHGDAGMILCGGPQHRGPADVDVFDGIIVAAVRPGNRRSEWIQVHNQQINRFDTVLAHHRFIDAAAT